jgi:hypothetical protein
MQRSVFKKTLTTCLAASFLVIGISLEASAFSIDLGSDAGIDADVTLKYGVARRLQDQDEYLLQDSATWDGANRDDGNRNFDKGDLVTNRFSAVMDFDFHWGDYGVFVRPRAYYDLAYSGSNSNASAATNNSMVGYGGELNDHQEFTTATKDQHRDKAEILDAFAYGNIDMGERTLMLRVGRQVVSWGESLFTLGGVSTAQSPLDATQANVPGVELRDLFLPVGQVSAQIDVFSNLTMAGYYQWEWEKTRLDESGAYFSTLDFVDDAGVAMMPKLAAGIPASIDRIADEDPSDDGQYGLALRYVAEALNETEFGLYMVNYHEKTPTPFITYTGGTPSPTINAVGGGDWNNLPVAPGADGIMGTADDVTLGMADPANAGLLNLVDSSSYRILYAEDVKMYGFSVGGVIGETNVGFETTYRDGIYIKVQAPGMPPAGNPPAFMDVEEADLLQVQASIIQFLGEGWLWDNAIFMGEVGYNRLIGVEEGRLIRDPKSPLYSDKMAWGGTAKLTMDYYQVLFGLDMSVPVTYKFNPKGVSAALGTFDEGNDSVALGFDFVYDNVYKFGVSYTNFLNGAQKHPFADRDMVSATFSYTF